MLSKIRNHLLISLIFFILLLGQQYGFYALKSLPIVWLNFGKYLGIYLFMLFFTFTPGFWSRFFILSFLMILNLFQLSHLSYFGTQILPTEIYLLFTQSSEINGTLKAELIHVYIPLLFVIVPILIGWPVLRKFRDLYSFKIVPILCVLYFFYNPVRTYVTGNTWGRQPSTRELVAMNVYLSTSYFLGRILPHKLSQKNDAKSINTSMNLKIEKINNSPWDNVVIVLGESLTPNHMSLFNYFRPTTPFLTGLKKNKNFFFSKGLSSGVSTDISVAFFLNLGFGSVGSIKAAKGEYCLFKMAKQSKFSTHFLSMQSEQQLRYISPYLCSSFLDEYQALENISPKTANPDAASDRDLLPKLESLLKDESKKFIILHQRGSHAPWGLRYSKKAAMFTSAKDSRVDDYDNSVVEFDLFWEELTYIVEKSKTKTLIVYLSDHGEALGENGVWGHGTLSQTAFEVPVIIQSFQKDLPAATKKLPFFVTHYNLSIYILNQLGLEMNQQAETVLRDYVIYGNDIDGFAGRADITFGPKNSYEFKISQ